MARYTLLRVLLFALPGVLSAQSSWDRYKPGTMRAVMDRARSAVLNDFKSGSDSNLIFWATDVSTLARVEYEDSLRSTPPAHLKYLDGWARSFRLTFDASHVFPQEVLVREDSLELWLPVQDTVAKIMRQQLHRGDQVLLYVVFAGAEGGRGPDIDWMFIINDFRAK